MPPRIRHTLIGVSKRLARHVLARRALQRRMYASTPIRFLSRLQLLPESYLDRVAQTPPDWWSFEAPVSPEFESVDALAFGEDAADPVTEFDSVPEAAPLPPPLPPAATSMVEQAPRVPVARREDALVETVRDVPDAKRPFHSPVVRRADALKAPNTRRIPAASAERRDRASAAPGADEVLRAASAKPAQSSPPEAPGAVPLPPPAPAVAPRGRHEPTAEVRDQADVAAMPPPMLASAPVEEAPPVSRADDIAEPSASDRQRATSAVRVPESPQARAAAAPSTPQRPRDAAPEPAVEVVRPVDGEELSEAAVAPGSAPLPASATPLLEVLGDAAAAGDAPSRRDESAQVAELPAPAAPLPRRRARVEEIQSERAGAPADTPESARAAVPRTRPTDPRRPTPPEPPREREGDRLFQPVEDGVDRSPLTWATRLAQAMRPPSAERSSPRPGHTLPPGDVSRARARTPERAGPVAPRAPAAASGPPRVPPAAHEFQLPERSRRFLKPLVGLDPAAVTIVQGPAADQLTADHQADALAVGGDAIVVGSAFNSDLPRDLGLIAHELTHIARERRPRFVPPVIRADAPRSLAAGDEETVARRVEARAVALAQDSAARRNVIDRAAAVSPFARTIDTAPADVFAVPSPASPAPGEPGDWGGLPAPWEPLPDWIGESPARPETQPQFSPSFDARSVTAAAGVVATPGAVAAPAASGSPAHSTVHAAESGRAIDAPAPAGAPPGGEGSPAVPPDIDQLARQVYAALKRRLETDSRRERMFRG